MCTALFSKIGLMCFRMRVGTMRQKVTEPVHTMFFRKTNNSMDMTHLFTANEISIAPWHDIVRVFQAFQNGSKKLLHGFDIAIDHASALADSIQISYLFGLHRLVQDSIP